MSKIYCAPDITNIGVSVSKAVILKTSQLENTLSDFTNEVLNVVLQKEPLFAEYLRSHNYQEETNAYAEQLANVIYTRTRKFDNLKSETVESITEDLTTKIKEYNTKHLQSLKSNEVTPSKAEVTNTFSSNTDLDENLSNDDIQVDTKATDDDHDELIGTFVAKLDGDVTYDKLLKGYFKGLRGADALVQEFENHVIQTFYDHTFGLNADNSFYNSNISEVKKSILESIKDAKININEVEDLFFEGDSFEIAQQKRKSYYNVILNKHFDSVMSFLTSGIDWKNLSAKQNGRSRDAMTSDDAFVPVENMSDYDKMLMTTTPLLTPSINGSFTTKNINVNNGFVKQHLSLHDFKRVADDLSSISTTLSQAPKDFLRLLNTTTGSRRMILQSIYNRFFNPQSFVVDGKKYFSLTGLAENLQAQGDKAGAKKLNELLINLRSQWQSLVKAEHITSKNGVTSISNSADAGADYAIKDNIETHALETGVNAKYANNNVSTHLELMYVKDVAEGKEIKFVVKKQIPVTMLLPKRNSTQNGFIVKALDADESLSDPNIVKQIFDILLPGSDITSPGFFNEYKNLVSQDKSLALKEFTTNMVYMLGLNLPSIHFDLSTKNAAINISPDRQPNKLTYPIFESLYKFSDIIAQTAQWRTGINSSPKRITANGNVASLVERSSSLDRLGLKLRKIQDYIAERKVNPYLEKSIFEDNTFAQGKTLLLRWVSKDGLTINGETVANKDLTPLGHHIYLMENAFLTTANNSKFKSALVQPLNPSDRSNIKIAEILFTENDEFLPVDKNGRLNEDLLRAKLINSEKKYHNNLQTVILNQYKKVFEKLGIQLESFPNTLRVLDAELAKLNIPYSLIQTTELDKDLCYIKKKLADGSETARISHVILDSIDIWNDEKKANDRIKHNYEVFRETLRADGYLNKGHELQQNSEDILKSRFRSTNPKYLKDVLVKGYFYHFRTEVRELKEFSTNQLYAFPAKIDQSILERDRQAFLKQGLSQEQVENKLKHIELDLAYASQFAPQTKRNNIVTNTNQKPILADETIKQFLLDEKSNIAVSEDEKILIDLLPSLGDYLTQDAMDGATLHLPLFRRKINNSLGGKFSILYNETAPIKDINVSYDIITGVVGGEKRANFTLTNEVMINASKDLHNIFYKMMNTIKYSQENLPALKVNEKDCDSLYEVFEAFGGLDNKFVWDNIEDLLTENPTYRGKYIELFMCESSKKTGIKALNTADVYKNAETPMYYSTRDNENTGIILNKAHEYDTTDADFVKRSDIALPTQFLAATVFEGKSIDTVNKVLDTVSKISEVELEGIKDLILSTMINTLRSKFLTDPELANIENEDFIELKRILSQDSVTDKEELNKLNNALKTLGLADVAKKEYAKILASKAIAKRENFGQSTDIINEIDPSFSAPQIKSTIFSAIASEISSKAVRMRFPGARLVLAPSGLFLKVYSSGEGNRAIPKTELINYTIKNNLLIPAATNIEKLQFFNPYDKVVYNGEVISFKDLGDNFDINQLFITDLSNSSSLGWTNYGKQNEDGIITRIKDDEIFTAIKELKEIYNNKELSANRTDEEKALLKAKFVENKRTLQNKLDTEYKTEHTISAQFLMPMLHAKSYNLPANEYLSNIIGLSSNITDQVQHAIGYFTAQLTKQARTLRINGENRPFFFHFKPIKSNGLENDLSIILKQHEALEKELYTMEVTNVQYKQLKEQFEFINDFVEENKLIFDNLAFNPSLLVKETKFNDILSQFISSLNNKKSEQEKGLIAKIATIRGTNFPKTLETVLGRIPSQAKQSMVAGQTAAFIHSLGNSILSPIEMYNVQGADQDGDEANVLTFSVDEFGQLYSIDEYLDENGNIDNLKISAAIYDVKLKAQRKFKGDYKKIQKAVDSFREKIVYAEKNYTVANLIQVMKDPKNAFEASYSMSLDEMKSVLIKGGQVHLVQSDDESEEDFGNTALVSNSSKMSPDTPGSIIHMELANGVGKDQVGIFATLQKAYSTTLNAAFNSSEEELEKHFRFNKSQFDILFEGNKNIEDLLNKLAGKQVFDKNKKEHELKLFSIENGELQYFSTDKIGGTTLHDKSLFESNAKGLARRKAWEASGQTEDSYTEELLNEARAALLEESHNEEKVWLHISELLSAATDNGKEFILGVIGATSKTSGIIGSMIVTGVPLTMAIKIINSPKVQKALKDLEAKEDPFQASDMYENSLLKVIESEIGEVQKEATKLLKEYTEEREKRQTQLDGNTLLLNLIKATNINSINEVKVLKESQNKFITNTTTEEFAIKDFTDSNKANDVKAIMKKVGINNLNIVEMNKLGTYFEHIANPDSLVIFDNSLSSNLQILIINYAKELAKPLYYLNSAGNLNLYYNSTDSRKVEMDPVFSKDVILLGNFIQQDSLNKIWKSLKQTTESYLNDKTKFIQERENTKIELEELYDKNLEASKVKALEAVTNELVQLHPFVLGSHELRALSGMLALNQGLPTSAWDLYNFFNGILTQISKTGSDIDYDTLIHFFESITGLKDDNFHLEVIDNYNKFKSIINPFYIVSKNPHFVSYLKALLTTKDLIDSTIKIIKSVDILARKAGAKSEEQFRQTERFLYSYLTQDFLQNSNHSVLTLGNQKYDLSKPESRDKFIREFPNIVTTEYKHRYPENNFLSRLTQEQDRDITNSEILPILKPVATTYLSPTEAAKYVSSLDDVRELDPELYSALFMYGLITSRGARGKNFYISLFDTKLNAYADFLNYLRDTNFDAKLNDIDDKYEGYLGLAISSTVYSVSTKNKKSTRQSEHIDDAEYIDDENRGLFKKKKEGGTFLDNCADHANFFKWDPSSRSLVRKANIIKSKELNKIFAWHENFKRFIPLSTKYTDKAIRVSDDFGLEGLGWQYGISAKVNNTGDIGLVYFYDDKSKTYKVKLQSGAFADLTPSYLGELNPTMVFRGNNFGNQSKYEASAHGFLNFTDESSKTEINLIINEKTRQDIIGRGVRYIAESTPSNLPVGSVVQERIHGVNVMFKYLGTVPVTDAMKSKMSYSSKNLDTKTPYIIEITLDNELTNATKVSTEKLKSLSSFVDGGSAVSRLMSDKSLTGFLTKQKGKLKVGEKARVVARSRYQKDRFFEIENKGSDDISKDMIKAATKLDRNLAIGEEFYSIRPIDDEYTELNSYDEGTQLRDLEVYNLDELNLFTLPSTNDETKFLIPRTSYLNKFGVTNKFNVARSNYLENISLETSKEKLADEFVNTFKGKNLFTNEEQNVILNTLDKSSSIVLFTSLKENNIGNKINFSNSDKAAINKLLAIVADGTTNIDFKLNKVKELQTLIKNKSEKLPNEVVNFIKNNNIDLSKLLSTAEIFLMQEKIKDTAVNLVELSVDQPYLLQAAKEISAKQQKELFVYDKSGKGQWKQYNITTGKFEDVRIPILDENAALLNYESQLDSEIHSAISDKPFTNLLKKTAISKDITESELGSMDYVRELSFFSVQPNEEINVTIATEKDALLNYSESITAIDLPMERDGDNILYKTQFGETVVDTKEFLDNTLDDISEINLKADGSLELKVVTANGNIRYFAAIPKDKKAEYADFRGFKVIKDFKFTYKGEKYVLSEVHLTNEVDFNLRDQLIQEKLSLKQKYATLNEYYQKEVVPIYKKIRYNKGLFQAQKDFGAYRGFTQFMSNLKAGNITNIDPTLAKIAIDNYNKLLELRDNARNYIIEQEKKYNISIQDVITVKQLGVDYNGVHDIFKPEFVLVNLLSNTDIQHSKLANINAYAAIFHDKNKLEDKKDFDKFYTKDDAGNKTLLKGFSLPIVAYSKTKGGYLIKSKTDLFNSLERLSELAKLNPFKKFIIDLPVNFHEKVIGDRDVISFAKGLSIAIQEYQAKSKENLPKNIIFANDFGNLVNEQDGKYFSKAINRVKPFTVTNEQISSSTANVTSFAYTKYVVANGERITIANRMAEMLGYKIRDVNNNIISNIPLHSAVLDGSIVASEYFGDAKAAYKALWRDWATTNYKEFRKLATQIGMSPILDFNSKNKLFSTGTVLAELLTERFVENTWINYDYTNLELPEDFTLNLNQTILPLKASRLNELNTSNGKTILKINDRTFLATIENTKHEPINAAFTNSAILADQLGVDFSEFENELNTKYPFATVEPFITLRLEAFEGEEIKNAEFSEGEIFSLVSNLASVENESPFMNVEHQELIKEATGVCIIDTKKNLTSLNTVVGTPSMSNYHRALGGRFTFEPKESDRIFMTGPTLQDEYEIDNIKYAFNNVKTLIDKYCKVGATLLVGSQNGMEQEIKSYVLATYPKYNYDVVNKRLTTEPVEKETKFLVRLGSNHEHYIGYFNSNNNFVREEKNSPLVSSTVLFTDNVKGKHKYNVSLEPNKVLDLNAILTEEHISTAENAIRELVKITPITTHFDKERIDNKLVLKEQRFVERLILLNVLNTLPADYLESQIQNLSDFDSMLSKLTEEQQADYNAIHEKIFDINGNFNDISDIGLLAMSKSRAITLEYVNSLYPELTPKENRLYDIISSERRIFEKHVKNRGEFINTNEISSDEMSIVQSSFKSKNVNYRDIYQYLKTLGRNKNTVGNTIDGTQISDLISKTFKIDAFKDGETYFIINNDIISPLTKNNLVVDSNIRTKKGKDLNDINRQFSNSNPVEYKYLTDRGIKIEKSGIHGILGDFVLDVKSDDRFKIGLESDYRAMIKEAVTQLHEKIIYNLYSKLPKEFASFADPRFYQESIYSRFGNLTRLVYNHLSSSKKINYNHWTSIFNRKANEIESLSSIKAGVLYQFNFEGETVTAFSLPYKNSFLLVDSKGNIFKTDRQVLERQDIKANLYPSTATNSTTILSPSMAEVNIDKNVGGLLMSNGENIYANEGYNFEINKVDDVILAEETNEDGVKKRVFELNVTLGNKEWKEIQKFDFRKNSVHSNKDLKFGDKVVSLELAVGTYHMKNGIAQSATEIKDDLGTFILDEESNIWVANWKGGFKNQENVKFQRVAVKHKNNSAEKSSKIVSPVMLKRIASFLKKQGANVDIMSNKDIVTIYGKKFNGASGFTIDNKVVLNSDKVTLDTPIHEYLGHIYLQYLKEKNKEAYDTIIDMSVNHSFAKSKHITENYSKLDKENIGHEVFSTLIGLESQQKLEEKFKPVFQKIKDFLSNIGESIYGFFEKMFKLAFNVESDNFDLLDPFKNGNESLQDIMNKLTDEALFGNGSVFEDMNDYMTEHYKNKNKEFLTEEELKKELENKNYIREICL